MNITIFNEGRDEKRKPEVLSVYPKGIGGVLEEIIEELPLVQVLKVANLYEPECGLTEEILEKTDVLVYWSHGGNDEFPDFVAEQVRDFGLRGIKN